MELRCGDRKLVLHELRAAAGTPLLLLHELYGSSADWGDVASSWPGPVFALDFAGHGASDWIRGGWYSAEGCVADADLALADLGEVALAGSGLGAYVALLLAGARASAVRASLLLPGVGLAAAGSLLAPSDHGDAFSAELPDDLSPSTDPMTRCIERELRPVAYAQSFVDAAGSLLLCEPDGPELAARADWWRVAREGPRTSLSTSRADAFAALALQAGAVAPR